MYNNTVHRVILFFRKFFKEPLHGAYILCVFFFIAYAVLGIVRHNHYQSFGFDLGISHQVVWHYSNFSVPITTIDHVPDISELFVHVELIYLLLSPFYWVWPDARMLILLQAACSVFSGLAVFLLARKYQLHLWIQYAILVSYLLFYGFQNALWFDVHSATFGTAFVAWFLYFFLTNKTKTAILFFLLAITAKENIAGITFLIALVGFVTKRTKIRLFFVLASLLYLIFIFGIYFQYVVPGGYRFDSGAGMFSSLDPRFMIDTPDKRLVYLYTFATYGFLPLFAPLYLVPLFGNLASYFILGRSVDTAQGLFLQYRIELVPLISWALIMALYKNTWLQSKWTGVYVLFCALVVSYVLHLPLSYLTKTWFWQEPSSSASINAVIGSLRHNDAIVAQNNIVPHISARKQIYSLYPEKKMFYQNSPCGQIECDWFRWHTASKFLLVDTAPTWDIRHLFVQRESFVKGLQNLQAAGVIRKKQQVGTTVLYEIVKSRE